MSLAHEEPQSLQLGRLIAGHRDEIEQRWLETVRADVARTPDLELTQLRDGMPDYLDALSLALAQGTDDIGRHGHEAWMGVARAHGITRVRQGFDIRQLMHEFVVLHRVIREAAHAAGLDDAEHLLADAIEAAMVESVQAYVSARDYSARRSQAENIGFLTHELRNPLTAAIMAAQRLRRVVNPGQVSLLEMLDRSHRRLAELIEGVLMNEKLEAGAVESEPRRVHLGALLEDSLGSARAVAEEKGLDFEVTCDPDTELMVDPELVRAAVQNVADNAVKYTDHGTIEVSVDERLDEIELHVRDNCPGLSPEELETIFEPFRRGSTHKAGTGLGLAIARRAVEAQGGSIRAESPGPSGCHFAITLPRDVTRH